MSDGNELHWSNAATGKESLTQVELDKAAAELPKPSLVSIQEQVSISRIRQMAPVCTSRYVTSQLGQLSLASLRGR